MEKLNVSSVVEDDAVRLTDIVKDDTRRFDNSLRENLEADLRHGVASETARAIGSLIAQNDPKEMHVNDSIIHYRGVALEEAEAARGEAWTTLMEKQKKLIKDERKMEEAELRSGMHYYRNQGQYENMAINDAVEAGKTVTLQNPETGETKEYSQEHPKGATIYDR